MVAISAGVQATEKCEACSQRAASDRVDSEDELVAKEVVKDLLARMGIQAEVAAVDNPVDENDDGGFDDWGLLGLLGLLGLAGLKRRARQRDIWSVRVVMFWPKTISRIERAW